ncbi:MAG: endolytic transglycosylase MltG [Zoogloeaceae bacterium]|jgi:UPF0755 protein|nr:endolytic transglycosylase MltG [Zoogloeaceae bacterium]
MRFFSRLLASLALILLLLGGGGYYALYLRPVAMPEAGVEFRIPPGTGPRGIAAILARAGAQVHPEWFLLATRLEGQSGRLKAGTYRLEPGTSLSGLVRLLASGKALQVEVRLIEGWTFRAWRRTLDAHPGLEHVTAPLSEAELMARLGLTGVAPEGLFFPDTYRVDKYSSDLELLERAAQAMQTHLEREWDRREANLPYQNAYEALILASIVEKETGLAADRSRVAGVFVNRLRLGMRLQTDPTVIYGLGTRFDGNLRKADLLADTPYNTYTRMGLPPTPIAMPGLDSLRAALHPAQTGALYFVARGDGSSQFSATLEEHNQAVQQYQRRGRAVEGAS